jgi:RecA/RadA recombinase
MATKKGTKIASFTADQKAWLKDILAEDKPVEYVETGNVGLDLVLSDGKGLPMGSSTLFWARPGSGKTTVVVDTAKRLIQKYKGTDTPFKVLYLGVEDSKGLLVAMGMKEYMDSKDFIYATGQFCWRQVETLYEMVLSKEPGLEDVKLIVVDSINNVLSDQNQSHSVGDGDYGTRARERSSFYSKILPLCKEQGISSFFISQARKKQDAGQFGEKNRAAVTDVDLHNVDIILKCSAHSQSTDAEDLVVKTAFGEDKVNLRRVFKMDPKAQDCKNRYISGNTVELLYEKGSRVLNFFAVKKLLDVHKLLKINGQWHTFDPEICSTFGITTNKVQRKEANEIIETHIGELIDLLKRMGKYHVKASETIVPATDNSGEDED